MADSNARTMRQEKLPIKEGLDMPVDNVLVESYVSFHGQCLQSFYERRSYEWKFNFAVWTPLAILIGFAIQGKIGNNPFVGLHWLLVISHAWMFILYSLWALYLHGANKVDREWAYAYKHAVESYLREPDSGLPPVEKSEKVTFGKALSTLGDWSPRVQILMTATLLSASAFVLW